MLLLFDIDGTLVRLASQAHADALREAIRRIHGVDSSGATGVPSLAGRTDGEISRMILLDAGISAERIDERADEVEEETCRLYAEMCPDDLSATVVPGMPGLLEWLSDREDVRLALVTGNYEPVARIKLSRAGIGHFFPTGQGGFGSDHEDRAALPPIARRRAGHDGISYKRAKTIVIGDTPRDIACAHADDLRCFAVTTGPFDAADLSGADGLAAGPEQLRGLIEQALATVRA